MRLLNLQNVTVDFGTKANCVHALQNVSFAVNKGEMVAVIGKSGSGKSTLLNSVGGLCTITSGDYYYKDEKISDFNMERLAKFRNQNIGFVVQHFALIPDMRVFHNIALPLQYGKQSRTNIRKRVNDLCEQMEITEKMQAYPNQLSGGQCQRVAIARALACNPSLLLADEPTGSLDEETGQKILNIFKTLNKEEGITIIVVTHDAVIAGMCDRIMTLKDGKISKDT